MTLIRLLVTAALLVTSPAAFAVDPDEMLEDPALEARARDVGKELRCVVCQNETIDESNATLAQDMRRLVRQRIAAGDSNDEVLDYMVGRYGEFVLLRPRVSPLTWVLWFGPFILLIAGAVIVRGVTKSQSAGAATLTAEEAARLDELLEEKRDGAEQ